MSAAGVLPRTLARLEAGRDAGEHLGAQIYVSVRGRVLADEAIGEVREGVPLTRDTVSLWFSSGKPLTSIAVAMLVEQGALDLEAPVTRWLPEFGAGGKGGIRVRHLLEHTAGFRGADRLPDAPTWEATLAAICAVPLEDGWEPGHRAGYQLFSSWFVLAELFRRIEGRPLERWLAEVLFPAWGMEECWMGIPADVVASLGERLGWMHFVSQGRLRPHPVWNELRAVTAVRPGGNVRGPVRSLGRFYEALLGLRAAGAERILRPETLAEFTRPRRVGLWDETFRHGLDWGWGFAVNSNQYGAETVPYGFGRHASWTVFGHGGSQSSCGFADPEHGLVGAWVCNGMIGEPAHQRRAREIQESIYLDLGLGRGSSDALA